MVILAKNLSLKRNSREALSASNIAIQKAITFNSRLRQTKTLGSVF